MISYEKSQEMQSRIAELRGFLDAAGHCVGDLDHVEASGWLDQAQAGIDELLTILENE